MKILEVIMDNRLGGIAQRAMLAAARLRERGHETVFMTPNEPGDIASTCRDKGYRAYQPLLRRPHNKRIWVLMRWFVTFPICVWQMKGIIQREEPDIVHVNGLVNLQAAVAARWCRVPIVWHLAGTLYPKWLVRRLIPKIIAQAHVVCISSGVRDYFLEDRPTLTNESIIHEPVDFEAIAAAERYDEVRSFRREHGVPQNATAVLSIGNLSELKGFHYLVDAADELCRRHENLYFAIVGGKLETQKSYVATLEQKINDYGLQDKVILAGKRTDVFYILKEVDIFILPSQHEGTPLSILEAMAAHVPAIATNVGGIPDQIEDGTTGLLVEPRDSAQIVEAIDRLIANPSEAKKLAEAAHETALIKFSMEGFLDQFLAAAEREIRTRYASVDD